MKSYQSTYRYILMISIALLSCLPSAYADTPYEIIETITVHIKKERLTTHTKEVLLQAAQDPEHLPSPNASIYQTLGGLEAIYEYNNRYHRSHRPILRYLIEQSSIGDLIAEPDSPAKRHLAVVVETYLYDIDQRHRRALEYQNLERMTRHHDTIARLSEDVTIPIAPESSTYQSIVVDISEQRMYLYEEGILVATSPITSGRSRFPTPTGIFHVQKKQQNKFMKSPFASESYELHVDYWIQFFPKYGIHDACNSRNCWRTEFGAPDYKTRGSHGCINAPYEFMSQIYQWVLPETTIQIQR